MVGKFVKEMIFKGNSKGLSFLFTKGEDIMVKAKAGGIVLGGLAAYLILSKSIGAISNCVRNICTAHEWKNYYKYGKDGNMVPPGYASHTRQINDNEEKVTESPEEQEAQRKQANDNASNKGAGAAIAESIVKAISDIFLDGKKAEGGLEGRKKAYENVSEPDERNESETESTEKGTDEEESVCPENCDNCQVKKCPWESVKLDGMITDWDDNGEPVAGEKPWSDHQTLHWYVSVEEAKPIVELHPDRDDLIDNELKDPLYVESLENGVELADDESEDVQDETDSN